MTTRVFAAVVMGAGALAVPGSSSAAIPLTQSRPFQAVCEAQGGRFEIATDLNDLYCVKSGGLFTAFTRAQLAVQRRICERVYGGTAGLQGEGSDSTRTWCSGPAPAP